MPVLAIVHKFKRVTHYEIQCEKIKTIKADNYIEANGYFYALLKSEKYGDFIKLVEFRKNKEPRVITKLVW